ncbi:hypothetical protein P280DRAFT_466115 [Massarina eburnea CBS 473.64]|uniref:Histone transcription regulator 3 homolog n=1 Tax=Massarina eburnea CBS 473.64 TaxID=1395130 RepID=A0A6A6SC66_9PLEO|nr:hypothetical protein P280DRAFT_466115 [Massarina eburnea CBS 473.64]
MSTWHALNVESDHEEEDEVDDTKEIQIEEALKLYQTALKLHSEGPPAFERAAVAYKELFDSEIFKYDESLSEYKRHELYADTLVFDSILQDDYETGPVQSVGGNESAPNTLPQILHLSYKNHGQFLLETMQHWVREHGPVVQQLGASQTAGALAYFAEALDKEDTDLDLWLRTASVAAMLGSQRITRFCLEAVLDGNDELYDNLLPLPGLEEGFAGQQLRELVAKLEDSLSLMQSPLSTMKRKKLSETLKKRLNPYPFAPLPADITAPTSLQALVRPPERVIIIPTKWNWAGVGESILRHYMAEQNGLTDNVPSGSCLNFNTPPYDLDQSNRAVSEAVVEEVAAEIPQESPQPEPEKPVAATLDGAAPTARDGDDTVMEDQNTTAAKPDEGGSAMPAEAIALSSRKRSTDSAGLPETAEGSRTRSKRLKAREITETTAGADAAGHDSNKQQEDRLWAVNHADQCLCEVINDMSVRLGVDTLGSLHSLRRLVTGPTSEASVGDSVDRAACDIYAALRKSGSSIAPVLLSAEPVDLGGASREAGLNAFLGHSKAGNGQACVKPTLQSEQLATFVHGINDSWLSTKEVAFAWLEMLLSPNSLLASESSANGSKSSYIQYRWAEDLKRHLVQIIVNLDDFIHEVMSDRIERLNTRVLKARQESREYHFTEFDKAQTEILETLFELHLDVYSLIKHPNSGVDTSRKTLQNDSLERWASLSREAMQLRSDCESDVSMDQLALRHIWASVFQMSVNDDVHPEHVIYAMEELKAIFDNLDAETIQVQNNAVMPELSTAAVDRELVRISMKDFFLKVFDTDEKDPVAVIESLEPIVEATPRLDPADESDSNGNDDAHPESRSPSTVGHTDAAMQQATQPAHVKEMKKFLDSASVNLRLSLWQRLREAYEGIEYPPRVLSCYLRSIETLTAEFRTSTYQECALPERHTKLISRLRIVDEIVVKLLQIIRSEADAFACLSYEHMQASMSAVFQLLRILSGTNFLQDQIRIGQFPHPRIEGLSSGTFVNMINRLNDMQMRLWTLQYYLLKEGMSQNPKDFPIPSDEAFEFLRHVHHATGVRCFSHSAGRLFLRLAKDELLRLNNVTEASNLDNELSQVLYDLYGLKTFVDPLDGQEYGSVPDILERKTATSLLPFIMSQAEKVGIKDVSKHDIKTTIEKVHGALGRPKANEDISLNRKMITTYFRSPINPVDLFSCLKGVSPLTTKHIPTENSVPASLGWFFLMGNISLNKFRSQKRQAPGSTEDLNFAQAFFLQDLEYSAEHWESWYRIAQAKDSELEESVLWNTDKMNNNSVDLVNYQRAAIHCYTMAVACAVRDADLSPQTRAKTARMYMEFGNRIYASTTEPFSMNAYAIKDTEHKYYSGSLTQNVYQDVPFRPLSTYTAWKIASVLFKRASRGDPKRWWNYYMLGKCLWKMYCAKADAVSANQGAPPPVNDGPTWEDVCDAIANAIETLPEKKERGREPVLEPHYKLVSITHKLFQRKVIDHKKGAEILQKTPFAKDLSPDGAEDWERYMLAVLKALRATDKSSWHHRIIARAAHVIYDDNPNMIVAIAAKQELSQQIFTKTMSVQVWKPEHERPGRHFVFTTRYTRFFIHLLDQTNDKTGMELLAKRVRKKQTDFFEHGKLWQELCTRYLRLLRRTGQIPDGHEDTVFRALTYDEYNIVATRLETWGQNPATQNGTLDILRDVVDLKRLNNGLMKPVLIDDLLGDTFALLYATVGPTLQPLPSEQPKIQAAPSGSAQQSNGAPYMSSLMQVQVDGNSESSPFNLFHPSQLNQPPLPPQQADTVTKSRPKPVGRREIQRRAETCAQKPAGAVAPVAIPIRSPPPSMSAKLPLTTDVTRPSPEKQPSFEQPSSTVMNEHPTAVSNSGTVTAAASVTNVDSAPASVHDSADDESELSELDESEVQEIGQEAMVDLERERERGNLRSASVTSRPSLFPGLLTHKRDTGSGAAGGKAEEKHEAGSEDEQEVKGEGDDMDTS